MKLTAIILLFLVACTPSSLCKDQKATTETDNSRESYGVLCVVDGDTFRLDDGRYVRLIGVNTPEKGDAGYDEGTDTLKFFIEGEQVKLEKDVSETDKYHRLLRYVYADDLFVNEELVKYGVAEPMTIQPDTKYAEHFKEIYEAV